VALTVVIAYDVSADNRRARLAALLQQYGDKIQFSVFLCRIAEEELEALLERGRSLVDLHTDSIYVLRQCADCWEGVVSIGQAHPPEPTLYWAVW